MCLQIRTAFSVPEQTKRIAQAAFSNSGLYIQVRDQEFCHVVVEVVVQGREGLLRFYGVRKIRSGTGIFVTAGQGGYALAWHPREHWPQASLAVPGEFSHSLSWEDCGGAAEQRRGGIVPWK